eukprot:Skav220343  [mRNA]  locus=scaffold2224:88471:94483:+ [translate_table: standard]
MGVALKVLVKSLAFRRISTPMRLCVVDQFTEMFSECKDLSATWPWNRRFRGPRRVHAAPSQVGPGRCAAQLSHLHARHGSRDAEPPALAGATARQGTVVGPVAPTVVGPAMVGPQGDAQVPRKCRVSSGGLVAKEQTNVNWKDLLRQSAVQGVLSSLTSGPDLFPSDFPREEWENYHSVPSALLDLDGSTGPDPATAVADLKLAVDASASVTLLEASEVHEVDLRWKAPEVETEARDAGLHVQLLFRAPA